MNTFWTVYSLVLYVYFLILIGRLILEWVQVLSRDWRPRGPMLVLAEVIYTLTDPPLKLLRRVVPAPRIGGMRLDLSFLVLTLLISLLMQVPARVG